MYKKITSIISWAYLKTWTRSTPDKSEEWEGGLGSPYRPRTWTDDYYNRPDKATKDVGG